MSFIQVTDVYKSYKKDNFSVDIIKGINLTIQAGEFVVLMGPSGSGKSTLLQMLGALDVPTRGEISINDEYLSKKSDTELSIFRRRNLGFIFQFFNLMPTLSALENVSLPCLLDGKSLSSVKPRAAELLEKLGLKERMHHKPFQLSGGEMQRVAIARALVNQPSLILADEPTGNLDSKNSEEVLSILKGIVREHKTTLIMVTHDNNLAQMGDQLIRLKDGQLQ
jgi:putative ABC transport system ATP-binding protein